MSVPSAPPDGPAEAFLLMKRLTCRRRKLLLINPTRSSELVHDFQRAELHDFDKIHLNESLLLTYFMKSLVCDHDLQYGNFHDFLDSFS